MEFYKGCPFFTQLTFITQSIYMEYKHGVIKELNRIEVWALSASVCDATNMLSLHAMMTQRSLDKSD